MEHRSSEKRVQSEVCKVGCLHSSSICGHKSRLFTDGEDFIGLGVSGTALRRGLLCLWCPPRSAHSSLSFIPDVSAHMSPFEKGLALLWTAVTIFLHIIQHNLWLCIYWIISCLPSRLPVYERRNHIIFPTILFSVSRALLTITEWINEQMNEWMLFLPLGMAFPLRN